MADAYLDIGWNLSEIRKGQKETLKVLNQFEKKANKSIKLGGLNKFAAGLGGIAASYLSLSRATDLAADSFRAFASFDALVKGLELVADGAEDAEAQLVRLEEIAKRPGLGFREAVQGSVRLQSIGFSAEFAEQTLSEFANALALVGGNKDDLKGVTRAITQISAKGVVLAEEIQQIAERLPQVRVAMQEAFGTANTEELQRRGIGAEEFIRGLVEALGTLDRAQDSTRNQLDNIADSMDKAKIAIGRLMDIVQQRFGVLNRVSDSLEDLRSRTNLWSDSLERAADAKTLARAAELLDAGDLEGAKNAIAGLNDELRKLDIQKSFPENIDYIRERLRYMQRDLQDSIEVASKLENVIRNFATGISDAPGTVAINPLIPLLNGLQKVFSGPELLRPLEKLPYLLKQGRFDDAVVELSLTIDDAVVSGQLDTVKQAFLELKAEADATAQELGGPGPRLLADQYQRLAEWLEDTAEKSKSNNALIERRNQLRKEEEDRLKANEKAQGEFNKTAAAIEKVQLNLLPTDEAIGRVKEKLLNLFQLEGVGTIGELSKLVEKGISDGNYALARDAGKALLEARKLQDQINSLAAENLSQEKAEKAAEAAREQYRIETRIQELRNQGKNEEADGIQRNVDTQSAIESLKRAGVDDATAVELVRKRFDLLKKIADVEKGRASELFSLETQIAALRAAGDDAGAAELQKEIDLRREAVTLQSQLNIKYEDALNLARARSALTAKAAADDIKAEIDILRLRARGEDDKADALERENQIKAEALDLQRQLNLSAKEALKLAREKRDLQDAIRNRDEAKRRDADDSGRRKIKFKDGVQRRVSFLGIDGVKFDGLDKQTFKGLDRLDDMQEALRKKNLQQNVVDAAAKAVEPKKPPQQQKNLDVAIEENTARTADAIDRLQAQ